MTQQTAVPSTTRHGTHQQYDWVHKRDVLVAMRDGERLALETERLAPAHAPVVQADAG